MYRDITIKNWQVQDFTVYLLTHSSSYDHITPVFQHLHLPVPQ